MVASDSGPLSRLSAGRHLRRLAALAVGLAILAAALVLRVDRLDERYPNEIIVLGSGLEYQMLANHLWQPEEVAPPGNPIGWSLVLALVFAISPFSDNLTQVSTSIALSMALIPLTFVLARRIVGLGWAAAAAIFLSVNSTMATNAARGTTEEVFAVSLLIVLLVYLRMNDFHDRGPWQYALLGASLGWLTLVRKDAMLLIAFLFVVGLVHEHAARRGVAGMLNAALIVVVPLFAILGSNWYQDFYGIKSSFWRGARSYFWFDFFRGRMPWEYMFYAKINLVDWWFEHHSFAEMLSISSKSTVRMVMAIGESMWGLHVLSLSFLGAARYVKRERDIVWIMAVPLALIPQLLWIVFSSDEDAFRYIVRILPLTVVLAVLGARAVFERIRSTCARFGFANIAPRISVALLVLAFVGLTVAPGSAYAAILPLVSFEKLEKCHSLNRDIHDRLARTWNEFKDRKLGSTEAHLRVYSLISEQPLYAPSYYVNGLVALAENSLTIAESQFEQALEIVPYFAEAGMFLAETYQLQGRDLDAQALLARLTKDRSEFSILHLQYAQVLQAGNEKRRALREYQLFVKYNRSQTLEALHRNERQWTRYGEIGKVNMVRRRIELVESTEFLLTTPVHWGFQGLDLGGLEIPMPFDLNTSYEMALLHAELGQYFEAAKYGKLATKYTPADAKVWHNLAVAYVKMGELAKAESTLEQGFREIPEEGDLWLTMAKVSLLKGDEEYARACYNKSLELDPIDAKMAESTGTGLADAIEILRSHRLEFMSGKRVLPITMTPI